MTENNQRDLQRNSSAVTMSDMEVFIFPELMFSLLLANIMSPRIWRWRDDPWFVGLTDMKPYRRVLRLKQYIMDHYAFNLDLDTWGLTTKERELARFRDFIDEKTLARSNALFGYEGDKYYFDIDIRAHFGLDKVSDEAIPYWKTETVEAMDAFCHKPEYTAGAGECVSLAVLYAAALFIVARIPLSDIYLMATPLHSQNFVDVDQGILTNNRRLVTKNMWCNGTALSAQARRALENERVTIVGHESGFIHTLYPETTIDPRAYARFCERLRAYLRTPFSGDVLGNFLRHDQAVQKCCQLRCVRHGTEYYIAIEKLYRYEHNSSFRLTDRTRDKLIAEVDAEEFEVHPLASRIILNDLEKFIRDNGIDMTRDQDLAKLKREFADNCLSADIAIESLRRFCRVEPRLPDPEQKTFVTPGEPLAIVPDMQREEIVARLESIRAANRTVDMAFYACRDLTRVESGPFLLAAMERNPVCVAAAAGLDDETLIEQVRAMPEESIYDGDGRLAQPDEVWNFRRGDGVEKALLLGSVLHARRPEQPIRLQVGPAAACLEAGTLRLEFASDKGLGEATWQLA